MIRRDYDYTIWFVPVSTDFGTPYDYMWSLAMDEAKRRDDIPEGISSDNAPGNMYAKLTFGGHQHAYHLMKLKHPVISEPVRKRDVVEIIGRDGDIDLYEELIDKPIFERRTITESFLLLGEYGESGAYYPGEFMSWAPLISQLKNYFNSFRGQMRIVLSHDPSFYWEGRVTASVDQLDQHRAIVRIEADVEPYKYERYDSCYDPWVWDDFSFVDGIIRDYANVLIEEDTIDHNDDEVMDFVIPMRLKDAVPTFYADGTLGDVMVSDDGRNYYTVPNSDGLPIDPQTGNRHPIQLKGTRSPWLENRHLYIKRTVDSPRHIWIEMRGATL